MPDLTPTPTPRPAGTRGPKRWPPELLALKHFAKAMDAASDAQRIAAIHWLVAKYLQ